MKAETCKIEKETIKYIETGVKKQNRTLSKLKISQTFSSSLRDLKNKNKNKISNILIELKYELCVCIQLSK